MTPYETNLITTGPFLYKYIFSIPLDMEYPQLYNMEVAPPVLIHL